MKRFGLNLLKLFFASGVLAILLGLRGKVRRARDAQPPYYESHHVPQGPYEKVLKRGLDGFLSSFALILLSPVLLVTALLVRIKLGTPVLFKQARPGREGKIFHLYKFRTMTDARDAGGNLLPDEERLTPFGKKLRDSSLDELPELLNIAEGDMALVGPRPLLVQYLDRYTPEQLKRHDVLPGLTGLAQVHGRNALSWEEKFAYDIDYVRKITFRRDVRILLDTVKSVLHKEGIHSETSATMEEFQGSAEKQTL